MRHWVIVVLTVWPLVAVAGGTGGIVTLYALDPLASTLSFGDGGYGHVLDAHVVKNRNSDIDFGQYKSDHFSVGIEGGRLGAVVDLGTAQELQERYGYAETVGKPQGFSAVRIADGKLVILKDYKAGTVQPLKEEAFLSDTKSMAQAPVIRGHIYLIRIVDQHDRAFERVAKVLVLEHQTGASVTLRWETLK